MFDERGFVGFGVGLLPEALLAPLMPLAGRVLPGNYDLPAGILLPECGCGFHHNLLSIIVVIKQYAVYIAIMTGTSM